MGRNAGGVRGGGASTGNESGGSFSAGAGIVSNKNVTSELQALYDSANDGSRGGGVTALDDATATSYMKGWFLSTAQGQDIGDRSSRERYEDRMARLLMAVEEQGGFPADVARTVRESERQYGMGGISWRMSEKQAYILGRAAAGLRGKNRTVDDLLQIDMDIAARRQAERERRERDYEAYSNSYERSSTKVATGSKVTDSKGRRGEISRIITKSSGYVEVKYEDGTTRKQMAFNLRGEDGKSLKKRPKDF